MKWFKAKEETVAVVICSLLSAVAVVLVMWLSWRIHTEYLKPVDNSVEIVEDTPQAEDNPVDNPVNDVHDSAPVESEQLDTVTAATPVKTEECYEEQLEILALIIYQEAGGDACSDDTRRKVGSVFLNRVNSPLFPDLFAEVALAPRQYGTLHYTGLKWPDRASNPGEAHAVDRAYMIADELLRYGSILPPNVVWQAEFKQGTGVYCEQDGLYFCY